MMAAKKKAASADNDISLQVDADTLEELQTLESESIERIMLWEESILDALDGSSLDIRTVDIDVYLADGVLFELYGVLCYPNLDAEPLVSSLEIETILSTYEDGGAQLAEVAVDTEDDLVLVLVNSQRVQLYLNVGAWALQEWEELPD